jgi:hypothetical protein
MPAYPLPVPHLIPTHIGTAGFVAQGYSDAWEGPSWTPADPPPGNAAAAAYKTAHPGAWTAGPGGPVAKTPVKVGNAWINQPADSYLMNADGSTPFAAKKGNGNGKSPPRRR